MSTRELHRRKAVEELLLRRLDECEICLVVDDANFRSSLLAGLGALELDVVLIRDQVSGHEHSALWQHSSERALLRTAPSSATAARNRMAGR